MNRFLEQQTIRAKGESLTEAQLYEAYRNWCERNGEGPYRPRPFLKSLPAGALRDRVLRLHIKVAK